MEQMTAISLISSKTWETLLIGVAVIIVAGSLPVITWVLHRVFREAID